MKKSILTIGLFSLMMVLTSFTAPETSQSLNTVNNIGGAIITTKFDMMNIGGAIITIKRD